MLYYASRTPHHVRPQSWIPPPSVFCEGKTGGERQITYDDVLKDFGFMEAKGFDPGFGGVNNLASGKWRNFCFIVQVK